MATCKQCREFEKCKDDAFINGAKFDPNESVKYCTGFEPITNSDRIRAMTDEELADFMARRNVTESCLRLADEGYTPTEEQKQVLYDSLYPVWMEWLPQPAEGE